MRLQARKETTMSQKHSMKTKNKKRPQAVRIEFHHEQAQAVFIAGTFNDWNPKVTPMIALGDGRWAKDLALPPGRYEYLFVVDGVWICDPSAPEQVPNPHGGCNSLLVVGTQP
jgi:1,4-alpha-glucan branching enzyme